MTPPPVARVEPAPATPPANESGVSDTFIISWLVRAIRSNPLAMALVFMLLGGTGIGGGATVLGSIFGGRLAPDKYATKAELLQVTGEAKSERALILQALKADAEQRAEIRRLIDRLSLENSELRQSLSRATERLSRLEGRAEVRP